jgi:hypothetical protein
MARTSASVVLLDATVLAASSGTKGAPGQVSAVYDNTLNYNSPLGITITNGASAPGTPVTVAVQVSDTNAGPWTDYFVMAGDSVAYNAATLAGVTSRTITLDKARFVKVLAYGNTTNNVDVKVRLHAVTGL